MTTTTSATTNETTSTSNNGVCVTDAVAGSVQLQPATTRGSSAMQSDEDFNIRFVNLVRMHRCLYDKKVPEYRNRDNQEKAWSLISHETRESVIHCKERWRNLRACLSRYIKQQSGSDPQHKPYYLTEHMAFLLPFLKSTRNSLDSRSLAALFRISQQHHDQSQPTAMAALHVMSQPQFADEQQMELKHSLSENDDEETIDAFDPVVTANLQLHTRSNAACSPPLSDTASGNTMRNFIPDVQLAELRETREPKRIKTESHAGDAQLQLYGSNGENADMEFFRSILPDIAALTPQQKRKFKIGVLELIDDVVDRFPVERQNGTNGSGKHQGRNSTREWHK